MDWAYTTELVRLIEDHNVYSRFVYKIYTHQIKTQQNKNKNNIKQNRVFYDVWKFTSSITPRCCPTSVKFRNFSDNIPQFFSYPTFPHFAETPHKPVTVPERNNWDGTNWENCQRPTPTFIPHRIVYLNFYCGEGYRHCWMTKAWLTPVEPATKTILIFNRSRTTHECVYLTTFIHSSFYSCELDLHLMTFVNKLDLDITEDVSAYW